MPYCCTFKSKYQIIGQDWPELGSKFLVCLHRIAVQCCNNHHTHLAIWCYIYQCYIYHCHSIISPIATATAGCILIFYTLNVKLMPACFLFLLLHHYLSIHFIFPVALSLSLSLLVTLFCTSPSAPFIFLHWCCSVACYYLTVASHYLSVELPPLNTAPNSM